MALTAGFTKRLFKLLTDTNEEHFSRTAKFFYEGLCFKKDDTEIHQVGWSYVAQFLPLKFHFGGVLDKFSFDFDLTSNVALDICEKFS